MLEVDIDKILPVTEARDNFNKIIDEVEGTDHMYVLTKNGKPSAVIVGVNHLEKLTGKTADELTSIVEKKADETPVVEEVTSPIPQGDNVAGGPKPPETAGIATGQSIQEGAAAATSPDLSKVEGPIDVPTEGGVSVSTENETASTPAPAPTSSPGSADPNGPIADPGAQASIDNAEAEMPAQDAGVLNSDSKTGNQVASNEPPLVVPADAQVNAEPAKSDSDLFV
ncbi:MAG: type II toxin-antitoxin system prevent-host-death family antitoxin [Patescibacteria group bacterium]